MAKKTRSQKKRDSELLIANYHTWKDAANRYHAEVGNHLEGAYKYAVECGKMLNKIKDKLPRPRKWKKWIATHFDASYETAKVYCRLANKWDDPRLVKARKQGLEIKSINAALKILHASKQDAPEKQKTLNATLKTRQKIGKRFTESLRKLDREELHILQSRFTQFWEKWRKEIYNTTCAALELELDEYIYELGRSSPRKPTLMTNAERLAKKDEARKTVKQALQSSGAKKK